MLTASGIFGPAVWSASSRDIVVYLVGEAKPDFYALRGELVEDAGDVVCDSRSDLREGESGWHDGWDEDRARGNDIGHDAEQLVATVGGGRCDLRVASVAKSCEIQPIGSWPAEGLEVGFTYVLAFLPLSPLILVILVPAASSGKKPQ